MKKFLLLIALALTMVGCTIEQYLDISSKSMLFTSKEETKEFYIKSNMSLSVTESPDWVSITEEAEGDKQTFTVTAQENESTVIRSSKIILDSSKGGSSQHVEILVTQAAKEDNIN